MALRPREKRACSQALAVLWLAAFASAASAHGPVDPRVAELSRAIAADPPASARLHLERAALHRVLRQWDPALADLARARELGEDPARIDLEEARVLMEADRPGEALAPLERLLAAHPAHARAWALRGRALAGTQQHAAAVDALSRAIAAHREPSPGLYLDRAASHRALGDFEGALRGLDQGIARLGPVVTLEQPAIELERQLKRFDAALARLERVARQSQRQDHWLVQRAEILMEAGRPGQAREALMAARSAFAALPPGRRNTRAGEALTQRIDRQLAALEPAAPERRP